MIISEFRGEYQFLSNFSSSPISFGGGRVAPTVEHAFQALKTRDLATQLQILEAHSPTHAKGLGRNVQLRADWEAVKLPIMRGLLALKFAPGGDLHLKLRATGVAVLIEGNTWGDRFWGVCDGAGQNWLGHLLMARRAECP